MISEVLVIGDEILSGQIPDTNSSFLARRLSALGIKVGRITRVGDEPSMIAEAIKAALKRSALVIASGGLGPTLDDQTISVAAKLFHTRPLLDEELLVRIERRFRDQNKVLPGIATRQALIPQGALVLDNPIGISPGLILRENEKTLILLPGMPEELARIFDDGVRPFLETTYKLSPKQFVIIRTIGITEAEIYERLRGYLKRHKKLKLAYLPSNRGVDLRLTAPDYEYLRERVKEIIRELTPWAYGSDIDALEAVVGELLRRGGFTLAVAESLTGGLIGDMLTDVPGSSDYFLGGAVVYSNRLKQEVCGVKELTLKRYGAVSSQTVSEMAIGIKSRFHADFGIGVSGIAGPGGGTLKKPVGLVYIGVAGKDVRVERNQFYGTRRMIKERSALAALDLLRRTILGL
jgi:nicotinamide-nucleotide amidase